METVLRLFSVNNSPSPDKNLLKVSGQIGYSQPILPQSTGAFDLLRINLDSPNEIYLNSRSDVIPRSPIIIKYGFYELDYEMFGADFPIFKFRIELDHTNDATTRNFKYKRI